jgi:hypothetical protein
MNNVVCPYHFLWAVQNLLSYLSEDITRYSLLASLVVI